MSFIGYSLGGLIVRAALPHLEKYSSKMHLIMTFCTPHLGYMYHSNKLVETGIENNFPEIELTLKIGLWFMKKWKKNRCLNELTMTDSSKLENTYLYKLSETKVIYFGLIILNSI